LHETKIQSIVNAMPIFSSTDDINIYIQNLAPSSSVTGDMIIRAATMYSVDVPLFIAIMQNDSAFGTLGVAARTFNPGNVGNTGSAERMYASWADGVEAVAEWLNRHRISGIPLEPVIMPVTIPEPAPQPTIETPVITPTPSAPEPTPVVAPEPLPPVETPIDTATTTPPIDEPAATTTPDILPETSTSTPEILDPVTNDATTTEPTL
jgi:hypothetical protein